MAPATIWHAVPSRFAPPPFGAAARENDGGPGEREGPIRHARRATRVGAAWR